MPKNDPASISRETHIDRIISDVARAKSNREYLKSTHKQFAERVDLVKTFTLGEEVMWFERRCRVVGFTSTGSVRIESSERTSGKRTWVVHPSVLEKIP